MQIYMHLSRLKFAAYIVVNKNDDDLYFERVAYDADEGARIEAKAEAIVAAESPPAKLRTIRRSTNAASAITRSSATTKKRQRQTAGPVFAFDARARRWPLAL